MWFPLGFENFVAKTNPKDDYCDIYVSNFIHIWHVLLSNEELLSTSKKLNPLLEAKVEKLRDIVFKLLEDVKVKKEIIGKNKNILLKLESTIMGIKFNFQVSLEPGNEEMLYNEMTLPLLFLLLSNQNKRKKLISLIKDKDAEIKNYKEEFGITSDFMVTEPFDEKKFDSQESTPNVCWNPDPLLECISTKLLSTKTEPVAKQQSLPSKEYFTRKRSVDKSVPKTSVFEDKNVNKNEGSKSLPLLDNKIIKKRRKINEGFKIKL